MQDKLHVTVGGNNVFDNYPDRETNSTLTFLGAKYRCPRRSASTAASGTCARRTSSDDVRAARCDRVHGCAARIGAGAMDGMNPVIASRFHNGSFTYLGSAMPA